MTTLAQRVVSKWIELGPRYMPFADVATPDLPFSKLLRLSLFQVSVGMALVLLVGTLNRVMIVELGVPASLVGIMVALPVLAAPFRAFIGFSSDNHRSELGWRRVPFIWKGTMLQFGGFAVMPFALLVLAGKGESGWLPAWVGQGSAGIAFLLVGAGLHTVQTAGLALATDLTKQESHPQVVGLMYVMLLLGMIVSALLFGWALTDFSPGRLVQVVQGAALMTLIINVTAMWKQETRRPPRGREQPAPDPSFAESWARYASGSQAVRFLTILGFGTLAFGMADILLEPYGGQVLALSVAATTQLTAVLALGGLLGFMFASYAAGGVSQINPHRIAQVGAFLGLPAFGLVIAAQPLGMTGLFWVGNFLIGFGGALFGHGTLTATLNRAPVSQAGLALGSWGAVQATAAGIAMALSGVVRDLVTVALGESGRIWIFDGPAAGYVVVYALEILFLVLTLIAIVPLTRKNAAGAQAAEPLDAVSGAGRSAR